MATTKEATPNSNAAVRDLDWMLVMGSLLCAKSAPTTSAPFSAPRLCASTRKVSHNEKLESDAFQAARDRACTEASMRAQLGVMRTASVSIPTRPPSLGPKFRSAALASSLGY